MTSSAEVALRSFILDYLKKRGLTAAAEGLQVDQLQKGEEAISFPPVDSSPNAFLLEWFDIFWDVFSTRLTAQLNLNRNRWHQQQQHPPSHHPHRQHLRQPHHNHQQHPQTHPHHSQQSQHLQQSHVQQQPPHPNHHPQHQPSPADPTLPVQPPSVQNTAHALNQVSADGSVANAVPPALQGPGPLSSAALAQNPQHVFPGHPSITQQRARAAAAQQQASQATLNHHAFRNAPSSSIPNTPQQLQNQQLRHHQQQQLLQASQRPSQHSAAAAAARVRTTSVENRRAISQSQLAHSLSLESTLQGHKASPLPQDQAAAAAALSGDMLEMNGTLDGILSSVGTRPAPRNAAAAAAAVAAAAVSGRGIMQHMPGRGQPLQVPAASGAIPLRGSGSSATKSRGFGGMHIPGSEAPSSASRRGSMDISVNANRPYDGAVQDESQPRTAPNGTSSTVRAKKRAASQNASRKPSVSSPAEALSPRSAYAAGAEGAGPAKRQRSSGLYQGNVPVSPLMQQLHQHQKQLSGVDLEQISRGLQQHQANPAYANARGRSAQLLAMQQRQQAFSQGTDRMSSAQLLSQLGAGEKGASRNAGRPSSRSGTVPNQSSFQAHGQSQNSRRRDAFAHGQTANGTRNPLGSPNERIADTGKGSDTRAASGGPKVSDPNLAMSHAALASAAGLSLPQDAPVHATSQGFVIMVDNQMHHVWHGGQQAPLRGNTTPFPGILSNPNASKKPNQNGGAANRNGKTIGRERPPTGGNEKSLHDEAHISEQIQRDSHRILESNGRKGDPGSFRMGQPFGREDLLKQSGIMSMTEQELTLNSEKKPPTDINGSAGGKGGANRESVKRNSSNRAMKTIETTGGGGGRSTADNSNSKGNTFNVQGGSLNASAIGSALGGKREKSIGDMEMESRSTKSDRQATGNRGGGTPSQKSVASGGSVAIDGRGTTSAPSRRGRGRSRARGGGNGRRGRERGGTRGGNSSRGANASQTARSSALEQKAAAAASSGLPLGGETVRVPTSENDGNDITGTSLLGPGRINPAQNVDKRSHAAKSDRQGRRMPKHADQTPKLEFEAEHDTGNGDGRGHDTVQGASHIPSEGGAGQLLDMLQQTAAGRGNTDAGALEQVDKAFSMQPLNLVGNNGAKLGAHGAPTYQYDIRQYLAGGVDDDTDIGNMLQNIPDNLALEAPGDFEDDNLLGVADPGDLGIGSGRPRS